MTIGAGVSVLFASCLKAHNGTDLVNDKGTVSTVIADVGPTGGSTSLAVNALPATEAVDLITLKSFDPKGGSSGTVHVKINVGNASGYDAFPASGYSLPLEYDVPIGNTGLTIPITLNKTSLDLTKNYGLEVSIASVSKGVIAENDKTMIVSFQIKNKYDGVYRLVLRHDGWAAYGIADQISATYPLDINMITAGASSLTIDAGAPFYDLQPGWAGGTGSITGYTAFGATTPKFTFDATTNALTSVVNTTPDDGRGRFLFINPAVTTSRYDPATKKIYAAYYMTQVGRPNQFIYDTLTYLRAR